jgi:superfamily I DNA and/or RNA helicase
MLFLFRYRYQCTEPESLFPLSFGISKLVLIGDPNQLPATVLSQVTFIKTLTHIYTEHSNNLLFYFFPFLGCQKNCLNSHC